MKVPEAVAVKVTAQLDVVMLTLARVQGDPVNEPVEVPVLVNDTVPAGGLGVPAADVSFTNAVQLVACATTTVLGKQLPKLKDVIAVEVVLNVTVTVLLVPVLPVWTPSVGL